MQGASRGGLIESRKALQGVLESGADWSAVSEDLFSVAGVIDGSATLRRALADPSRDAESKRGLVRRLLEGKVQPDLRKGRYPDRKTAQRISEVVRAVARELDR